MKIINKELVLSGEEAENLIWYCSENEKPRLLPSSAWAEIMDLGDRIQEFCRAANGQADERLAGYWTVAWALEKVISAIEGLRCPIEVADGVKWVCDYHGERRPVERERECEYSTVHTVTREWSGWRVSLERAARLRDDKVRIAGGMPDAMIAAIRAAW